MLPGEVPTIDDWSDHLTTLFPEVRLKKFLEMRGADGGRWRRICALPAFWTGLLSAVAKYESTWNENASGGGGRWIGLMQISPRSAANYGCDATSVGALKDGEANLECAVEIMSTQVAKDGLVAGGGNRGIGRDWAPLRSGEKRAAMAAWTRAQPYCKAT